jgi:exosortase
MEIKQDKITYNKSTVFIFLIGSFLVILYYSVLLDLYHDWLKNPDYSHGFLIPFATIYMIWYRREIIKKTNITPSNYGLILLIFGAFQYSLGYIGAEHFLQSTSMITVMLGICLYFYGGGITSNILTPILFLIFMIPLPAVIWNSFAFNIKLIATKIAVYLMQLIGIVVLQEGNVLNLPGVTLEVVDACSGLRSLISLLALSVLIDYLSNLHLLKKVLLVVLAIPIAMISNVIRLVLTAFLIERFGIDTTKGFYHALSGILVYTIGLIFLIMVYKLLSADFINKLRNKQSAKQ